MGVTPPDAPMLAALGQAAASSESDRRSRHTTQCSVILLAESRTHYPRDLGCGAASGCLADHRGGDAWGVDYVMQMHAKCDIIDPV